MAKASAVRFDPPLSEINTTPLIDVMLVLLVMLILTIPVSLNEVQVDLPSPPIVTDPPPVLPVKNTVTIAADGLIGWNGTPLDASQLAAVLSATTRLSPEPELRFAPDAAAPYDVTAKVLNTIKRSGVTAFGFVGNDRYARFGKASAAR